MDLALNMVEQLGAALVGMTLNPFYYVGLVVVALLYRRQVLLERRLFSVRLHSAYGQLVRAMVWGFIGGFAVSIAVAGTGLVLNVSTLLWVWAVTIVLLLLRIRFACLAYAAGIIGLLHVSAGLFPLSTEVEPLKGLIASLDEVHPPSLFALVALLHAVEALLIRMHGARSATPLFIEGKRGKIIGAYHLQGFWAVPLFLIVPVASGTGGADLPWPMFFGGAEWNAGWTMLAFPALIGFTQMTVTGLPERNARSSSLVLLGFAIIMASWSVMSEVWPTVTAAAALSSVLLHEWIVFYGKRRELKHSPFFVNGTRGLKILGVVPGSPAAEMGILRGEVILKANGFAVFTKEELHTALRTNSAFCKLEVLNLDGENKFVQRALFAGEHHQLGLILVPDDRAIFYAEWRPVTLLTLLTAKRKGHRQPPQSTDDARGVGTDV